MPGLYATPNSAVCSLHEMIASLLGTFTLVTQQPFGVLAFSLGMFHMLVVVYNPTLHISFHIKDM